MRHALLSSSALAAATLCFATPALAQDICGGMGAGGQWIGGSEAASDIATVPDVQEQMALVLGGNAYVALFNVSAPADVRIEAQGRGAADPQLDVFDETGGIIASDDDSGGGGAARAETTLTPGTYCVAVRSYDGTPMTSFVRIARTDQDALTPGIETEPNAPLERPLVTLVADSCANPRPLPGSLANGGLSVTASVNDGGFWLFRLDTDTALTLTAENPEADPVLALFDAEGTLLAENDDFDGLNAQIDMTAPLPAGNYCIQVTAVNDNTLPITTTVVTFDPEAALRTQVNNGEVAPPLDGSFAITDLGTLEGRILQSVSTTDVVQWFKFDMPAGLLLAEAVAVGDGTDTWMVLFDDLGRSIIMNDDYGDGLDSLIAARVAAGTYLLGVKQLEDGAPGPVRMVLEHYIAAP